MSIDINQALTTTSQECDVMLRFLETIYTHNGLQKRERHGDQMDQYEMLKI